MKSINKKCILSYPNTHVFFEIFNLYISTKISSKQAEVLSKIENQTQKLIKTENKLYFFDSFVNVSYSLLDNSKQAFYYYDTSLKRLSEQQIILSSFQYLINLIVRFSSLLNLYQIHQKIKISKAKIVIYEVFNEELTIPLFCNICCVSVASYNRSKSR